MSIERTLMSWARTATALIAFGFTIGEFLTRLNALAAEGVVSEARFPQLPVALGLTLIGVGTLGLAFACYEYSIFVRHLRAQLPGLPRIPKLPRYTPTLTASVALVAVGLITFVLLVVRRA